MGSSQGLSPLLKAEAKEFAVRAVRIEIISNLK
jgi:hypothetical protein